MVKKPRKGVTYWIIVDIYETICAAPVTIISAEYPNYADAFPESKAHEYTLCWQLGDDYNEIYGGYTRKELYKTNDAAWQAIRSGKGSDQTWIKARST